MEGRSPLTVAGAVEARVRAPFPIPVSSGRVTPSGHHARGHLRAVGRVKSSRAAGLSPKDATSGVGFPRLRPVVARVILLRIPLAIRIKNKNNLGQYIIINDLWEVDMQDGSSQGSVAYATHGFVLLAALIVVCLMAVFS